VPALANPRQELFAQELARGSTQTAAYEKAGYATGSKGNPSMLANEEHIQGRVAEILEAKQRLDEKATELAAARLGLDKERILRELMRIGFSDIGKAIMWSRDSAVVIDSMLLDDGTRAAIAEVSIKDGTLKIRMHSKIDALKKLGEHLGMWIDRVHVTGGLELVPTFLCG
jgi:phage terminase small subunit